MLTPIRAEGLERSFGSLRVLAGVDLTVEGGETVALLGPNGAGKTTLLRVLATLLRPGGGRLLLFGEDARARSAEVRRRIGFLGHESACYLDLTGAENLEFYAALFALADARARIEALLTWAGLAAAARRPVRVYSRGMLQRLALARALLHEPDLLLLDEPWSGLDPDGVAALDDRLLALRAAGHAILLTTHDVARAALVATRTAILDRGRIVWMSAPGGDATAVATAYRQAVGGRA